MSTYPTIAIASGKGGTGKTLIATSLALAIQEPVQLLDCDVEEPNAHVLLNPILHETIPVDLPLPEVDPEKCEACGKCVEFCAFNALALVKERLLVFPDLCHACGGCQIVCPTSAIKEKARTIGHVQIGEAHDFPVVDGVLQVGEAIAPPIIKRVCQEAVDGRVTIIDSAPGSACPMVEAVKDTDVCILVTEPTPFGLHDLTLAVEVLRALDIPFGLVLNRADVGDDGVEQYCRDESIPIWLRIPLDREIAVAYSEGVPLVHAQPKWQPAFQDLFRKATEASNGGQQ